jgi:drug/metabolite transporter (DMT)-like permease
MPGNAPTPGAARGSRDGLRLHLAVAGFGFAGVFGKLIGLGPVAIVAGRAGFAALAIAGVLCLRGEARDLLPRGRRDGFAMALGLLLAVHWCTFFQSVQVATVGVALVSFSTAPLLLLGMEALWRRAWPGPRPALASLAALAGVAVVAPSMRWSDASVRGMAWGIASGGTYALLVLLNRPLVRAQNSPWRLAMWQNAVAVLALSPFLAGQGGAPSLRDWALMAVLGVVFTAGTHGLFLQSIRTVPAHLAVLTCTLEPGYGILAAAGILGERPSPRTLLGAGIIAAAVVYAARTRTPGPSAV